MILAITLIGTLLVGCGLYYCSGMLRQMGAITAEEINDSEMFVTKEGDLEEVFPEELVTEKEVQHVNVISRISFLLISSCLWTILGLTAGRIAYLLRPGDLWKLIVYFIVYLFCIRIPFGIVNSSIEKVFEVKLMPDKIVIAAVAIGGYIFGVNYYEYLPQILKLHLQLLDQIGLALVLIYH